MSTANEVRMYETLRRIARDYQTPDQLRRSAERQYGLSYEEALEYAYENIQADAKAAIKGMKRPKVSEQMVPTGGAQSWTPGD
jgi:hypothetical protein